MNIAPQNVSAADSYSYGEVRYAGFRPRAGAMLLDWLLWSLLTVPLLAGYYGPDYWVEAWRGETPFPVYGPLDFWLRFVLGPIVTLLFWHRWGAMFTKG